MTTPGQEELLSLAHAPGINEIRRRYGHDTSSHAFQTLYIWRRFVGCGLRLQSDLFSLRYQAKGPNTWLFPCGDREAAYRFILERMGEPGFSLCYLRQQDADWLARRFPGRFDMVPAPGDSEYIVDREAHLRLQGKRYEKLRNKLHRAEKAGAVAAEPLSEANLNEALQVIRAWRENRPAVGALRMVGDEEDTEPLTQMAQLGITGILMRVDGMPYGVAAGFMLSEDTYDLFLAKDAGRDPCLGYCLRHLLMAGLPEAVRWVNL